MAPIVADLDIGILCIFAVACLGVYGIALAGWSSNNKYALMGGLRSSAQMISYELAMRLCGGGGADGRRLAAARRHREPPGRQRLEHHRAADRASSSSSTPSFAETNRLPFDLPEAEPELVAGYHTEYSSMKFALFFMAEYANMVTASAASW